MNEWINYEWTLRKATEVHVYVQYFSPSFQIWEDLLKFDTMHNLKQLSLKYLLYKRYKVNWELINPRLKLTAYTVTIELHIVQAVRLRAHPRRLHICHQ